MDRRISTRRISCICKCIGLRVIDETDYALRYVYLFFFNVLWVVFPLYVMYEAYGQMAYAFSARGPGLTSPSSGSQRRSGVARKKKA